nr:MAG TPA: hypothetical protein [Caudoviricetes sp.]
MQITRSDCACTFFICTVVENQCLKGIDGYEK